MKNIQYTIHRIPSELDSLLRIRAKKRSQSFNETLIEVLQKGTGAPAADDKKTDLDWFYGSGIISNQEEEVFAAQRELNLKDWL